MKSKSFKVVLDEYSNRLRSPQLLDPTRFCSLLEREDSHAFNNRMIDAG
jgi:hypothetical protein